MVGDTVPSSTAEMAPPTILLVESDVLIRSPLAEYLRHCGYRVLEAVNAREAKAFLIAGPMKVYLVFANAVLAGDENGFTLSTWLRRRWPEIRVLLTGSVANAAQRAGEVCEDGPMLERPYGHDVVLRRIQQGLLQNRRRQRDEPQ